MNIPIPDPDTALKVALSARAWYLGCVWGLGLVICVGAIYFSSRDHSWDAAWIAIFVCPLANLILMIGSLVSSFMIRGIHPALPPMTLYPSAFIAPVASAGVAFLVIVVFNVHRTPS